MIFHISYGWLTGTHIPFTIRIVLLLTCHLVTSSRAPSYTHPSQRSAMGRAMLALMKIGLTTQKYGKTLQPSCHDMDLALPESLQWMPCLWSVGISRKIIQFVHSLPAVHTSFTYKTLRSIGVPMEVPFQALAVAWPGRFPNIFRCQMLIHFP